MPIILNLDSIGKMQEIISSPLIFRNEAHFYITKEKRKKAYTMAVDIEINTITFPLYENGKLKPPIQFYGYATLVFQNMLSLEIPIKFPRQRLYYAKQIEALSYWQQWIDFYQNYQLHSQSRADIGLIAAALEIPLIDYEFSLKEKLWIELPLREVHVKLLSNSQFTIECSQWEAIPFEDPITGQIIKGESGQEDGEKDDGLPQNGIQPEKKSGNYDFANNPRPSNFQDLINEGLVLQNGDNLSLVNPENIAPVSGIWRITVAFTPPNARDGCGVLRPANEIRNFSGLSTDTFSTSNCNPRSGLNGMCFFLNGIYKGESYVCNPSSVSISDVQFIPSP